MMENFYTQMMEQDLNPFMMFDSAGKLSQYNKEAEFLLSYVSSREIYDLAVSNAPLSFGFKRSFVSLHYERSTYFAVLVGYLDEEQVGIQLFREVCDSARHLEDTNKTQVNIYTLLNLSKNSTLSNAPIMIDELFDPSIPDIKLNVEKFLNLLNHILRVYTKAEELSIKVFLKIGETMLLEGKKYPICSMKFQSFDTRVEDTSVLFSKAKEAGVSLFAKDAFIMIEFPLITS